jgi:hypothetical protein
MTTNSQAGMLAGRRLNPLVAGVLGAVFAVVGLLGFTISGGHSAAGHTGGRCSACSRSTCCTTSSTWRWARP